MIRERFGLTIIVSTFLFFLQTSTSLAFECRVIEPEFGRHYARMNENLEKGNPRTVQLVYFAPSDREFRPEVVENLQREIQNIRLFYGDQIRKHTNKWMSFNIKTDAREKPVVHQFRGKHPESYYQDNGVYNNVFHEIGSKFDTSANIYLVVVELLNRDKIDGADGRGFRNNSKHSGMAIVPDQYWLRFGNDEEAYAQQQITWRNVIAHELGHAFGLEHDFRDDTYMMSFSEPSQISVCNADFLSVHPYFNKTISIENGTPPEITLISSPTYPKNSQTVEVEIGANSPEGIHQVILFVETADGHPGYGFWELKECQIEVDGISVFNYDGVIPSDPKTRLSDFPVHYMKARTVSLDGNVSDKYFNLVERSPHHIATLDNTPSVEHIAFSFDSKLLATSNGLNNGNVNVWDLNTLQVIWNPKKEDRPPLHNLTAPEVTSWDVAFSPNASVLVTGDYTDRKDVIQLWDTETFQLLKRFGENPLGIWIHAWSLEFTPDGESIIVGYSNKVKIWNISTEQDTVTFHHANSYNPIEVACSPDGKIIASGSDNIQAVHLWDSATGNEITRFDMPGGVMEFDFSPDGTILAIGIRKNGDALHLYDVLTGNRIVVFHGMKMEYVKSVDFFPDGSALAFSSQSEVGILDMERKRIVDIFVHRNTVLDVCFSPDGSLLASTVGQEDQTVELWDMTWWKGTMGRRKIFKLEDINTDGVVDIQDLVIIASDLGETGEELITDINNDGTVNIQDLILVAKALDQNRLR